MTNPAQRAESVKIGFNWLKLSESKCARIHVGKGKCDKCLPIVVNKKPIKESYQEKYLGDYMTKNANPKATIEDRKQQSQRYSLGRKVYHVRLRQLESVEQKLFDLNENP